METMETPMRECESSKCQGRSYYPNQLKEVSAPGYPTHYLCTDCCRDLFNMFEQKNKLYKNSMTHGERMRIAREDAAQTAWNNGKGFEVQHG